MSTAPDPKGEVESLLAAARRDVLAYELLAAQPRAPAEVIFFLAQQAIEKAIKAVLAHRKVSYRKTHDLLELSALLADGALLELLPEDLMIRLAPYAVEMRYMSVAAPKVGLSEVTKAITNVLLWAKDQVQKS